MPYYVCIVLEKKQGSRLRRKMALEASAGENAKLAFSDKCKGIGFKPDFSTLREISRKEYDEIMATLLGKRVKN